MPKRKRTVDGLPSEMPVVSPEPGFELIPPKNQAAADLGRRGGLKGGAMRAARMTPEARSLSARAAASARWAKPPVGLQQEAGDIEIILPADADAFPPSPFAKHRGVIKLGETPIDVYVLDTGERVISLRAAVKSLADVDSSSLADYINIEGLKSSLNSELILAETVDFHIPGTQFRGKGISAERFLEICNAYVSALQDGRLRTDRQKENAVRCSILLGACAKVGLIALIDEATGYQYERAQDALQVKLQAYIAEELRAWEKTFPDELWEMFGRLTQWKGPIRSRPKWWGHLVNELIYEALDPDIAEYLKKHKPKPFHGQNYHQWLSEDVGLKALVSHIYKVIGMGDGCEDMRELRDKVAKRYGRSLVQLTLSLPKQKLNA